MTLLKLYSAPLSPFGARAQYSLDFKGLAYEIVRPMIFGGLRSDGYREINPLGKIPVLETASGHRIFESEVIVEFLEDAFPQPSLLAGDCETRARARAVARIADLYVITRLLRGGLWSEMMTGRGTAAPQLVARECAALGDALDVITSHLSADGPYALGDTPSVADGALVPYLTFLRIALAAFGRDDILAARSRLSAYLEAAPAHDPRLQALVQQLCDAVAARRAEAARASA